MPTHTLGGYSAHADVLRFIGRLPRPPRQVRIVHGDDAAKQTLAERLRAQHPGMEVVVP